MAVLIRCKAVIFGTELSEIMVSSGALVGEGYSAVQLIAVVKAALLRRLVTIRLSRFFSQIPRL